MPQRLQKIIAASGFCSRRKAEELIEAGRVTVNGATAALGDKALADDFILIDNQPLPVVQENHYILLHKPVGTVTTLKDPEGRPLVSDLFRKIPARLFPVGRLDLNTSGLLLMTNDGDLANGLAHPRHEVPKTYLGRIRGILTKTAVRQLEQGVRLDDGMTAPARVAKLRRSCTHSWFELTIHEGRNRQVRRMCEALGYPVSRLSRIGYAFLTLGELKPGQYRELSPQEVSRLKKLSGTA